MIPGPSRAPGSFARRLLGALLRLVIVVAGGVLVCAALVRYSPGFESEQTDIDSRISRETAIAIHERANRNSGVNAGFWQFSREYFERLAHGDLGVSRTFNAPVSGLLRERAAITAALMSRGIALGWLMGFLLAWLAAWQARVRLRFGAEALAGISLAIPPAVIAVAFFLIGAPLSAAVALAVLPRIFGTIRELLDQVRRSPALVFARARGISRLELTARYIVRPIAPELAALAGVSLVQAFGSIIPIEALCDVPGLGQLAWRAALGRDLPLLCGLAMVVTFAVALTQAGADVFERAPERIWS